MPRHPRVEYPGAIYHVMSRGDCQDAIYRDDVGRQDFLKTLAEACQKTGWQVHTYCLMRNHFHLVVETSNANLKAKVELAYRLRQETTLTIRQIAERLSMGSWKSLNNKLYLLGKERRQKKKYGLTLLSFVTCRCATLRPVRRLSTMDQERCSLPSFQRLLHLRNMWRV